MLHWEILMPAGILACTLIGKTQTHHLRSPHFCRYFHAVTSARNRGSSKMPFHYGHSMGIPIPNCSKNSSVAGTPTSTNKVRPKPMVLSASQSPWSTEEACFILCDLLLEAGLFPIELSILSFLFLIGYCRYNWESMFCSYVRCDDRDAWLRNDVCDEFFFILIASQSSDFDSVDDRTGCWSVTMIDMIFIWVIPETPDGSQTQQSWPRHSWNFMHWHKNLTIK